MNPKGGGAEVRGLAGAPARETHPFAFSGRWPCGVAGPAGRTGVPVAWEGAPVRIVVLPGRGRPSHTAHGRPGAPLAADGGGAPRCSRACAHAASRCAFRCALWSGHARYVVVSGSRRVRDARAGGAQGPAPPGEETSGHWGPVMTPEGGCAGWTAARRQFGFPRARCACSCGVNVGQISKLEGRETSLFRNADSDFSVTSPAFVSFIYGIVQKLYSWWLPVVKNRPANPGDAGSIPG